MNEYAIGIAAGILCAFLGIFIYYTVKGKKNKPVYDERQMIARNAAYKRAFGTLVVYCMVCGMLDLFDLKWATVYIQMYIGIFISIGVFAVLCILKDAYSALNENKYRTIWILIAVGVLNLAVFIINLVGGKSFLTDGMLNENALQPFMALLFLVVVAAMLIKDRINRKAEDEE